jgi:hypothetical protein
LLIDKATHVADKIFRLITAKSEPVSLMIYYNKLIDEQSAELVQTIASVNPK